MINLNTQLNVGGGMGGGGRWGTPTKNQMARKRLEYVLRILEITRKRLK